jgi:hypothetical protein
MRGRARCWRPRPAVSSWSPMFAPWWRPRSGAHPRPRISATTCTPSSWRSPGHAKALARDHHLTGRSLAPCWPSWAWTEHAFAIDRRAPARGGPGCASRAHHAGRVRAPSRHVVREPARADQPVDPAAKRERARWPAALSRRAAACAAQRLGGLRLRGVPAAGGFQSGRVGTPAVYPRALTVPSAPAYVPAMPCAARLLFSAAQLHGPTPHDEAETRFSVDVRVVARLDQRSGARRSVRWTTRSRGDASVDYALMGLASVDEALQWARGERA